MNRPASVLLTIALAFGVPSGPGGPFAQDAERAGFTAACDYYRARSGPEGASGPEEFAGFLAEACAAALSTLDTGTPHQRGHSGLLLSRIALLRETVAEMNADRAAARDGADKGRPAVTPSGEFLIAHRMGLLVVYDAWLDTGVHFSLASYP